MKFVQLSSQVRRSKDYRDDKKYYDAMLTNAMVKNALERAEVLGKNLEKHYDMAKLKIEPRENGSARKITPPPVKNNDIATPVKPANTITNGVANSGEKYTISVTNLTLNRGRIFSHAGYTRSQLGTRSMPRTSFLAANKLVPSMTINMDSGLFCPLKFQLNMKYSNHMTNLKTAGNGKQF
jgi:hypothetical protein